MSDPLEPPKKPLGPSTMSVHGGEPRRKPAHSLTMPIVQTATYTWASSQEVKDHFDGKIDERIDYGRYGNPTQRIAELKLAALEGAGDCLVFASGMGAMTTALLALLSRGTHVVVTDDSYRHTRQFLNGMLPRYGVEVSTVPAGDYEALEDAIKPTTRVLVSESPTNPYNRILDLERFAAIGRKHRVKTIIDATFATPYNARPLEWGVDLVMHSATKYLGGHNDLLAGAVLGSRDLVGGIRARRRRRAPPWIRSPPICSYAASRRSRCAWNARTPTRRRWRNSSPPTHECRRSTTRDCRATPATASRRSRCPASVAWCRSKCAATWIQPRGWSTRARSPISPRRSAAWKASSSSPRS